METGEDTERSKASVRAGKKCLPDKNSVRDQKGESVCLIKTSVCLIKTSVCLIEFQKPATVTKSGKVSA